MTQRISALQRAQYRLQSLQTYFSEQEKAFIETQKEYRRQSSNLVTFLYNSCSEYENPEEKKRAKEEYNKCSKEVTVMGKELLRIRKLIDSVKQEIAFAEMEVSVIISDVNQSQEKKVSIKILKKLEKDGLTDPLLKTISVLPQDIVTFIASFIPKDVILEIKIRAYEHQTPTRTLLACCSTELHLAILNSFSTQREFLTLLPYEEAVHQLREYYDRDFNPYARCKYTKEPSLKIRKLIEMAKASNPEFAYNMLKKLHILIDPTKKYKKAEGIRTFNTLTFEDLIEAHKA
jgi:hypothetical protein